MINELITNNDGSFTDKKGLHWDSKEDYLFCGVLPSCGCGNPEQIGLYVKSMLRRHVSNRIDDESYTVWENNKYEDIPLMFFLSWADREGYIEHGTTIRCSWLTKKGESLLRDLDEVSNKDIENE